MSVIEEYLRQLRRELRKRFVDDTDAMDEIRDHLSTSVEQEEGEGGSVVDAEVRAVERVGAPDIVASAIAEHRTRLLDRWLLGCAAVVGFSIAYVDSRPNWDDTGITAGALLITAAALGTISPRRPWLWSLSVGLWIPLYLFVRSPRVSSAAFFLILAFPLTGAYLGRLGRRVVQAVFA
jgi:hypothetical protein